MRPTLNLIILHSVLAWVLAATGQRLGAMVALGVALLATLVYTARILADAVSALPDELRIQTDRISREIDALRRQPKKDAETE